MAIPITVMLTTHNSTSHSRLPDKHFLLDEGPPPSTQPCEDRVACGPGHPNTSLQLLYSAWLVIYNFIKVSQEPSGCDWWSVDFHRPGHIARTAHCYLPYTTLGGSAPSYRSMLHNSLSKLLFYPDWTIIILSWQVFQLALSTLCNWSRMLQLEWSWTSQKEAKNLFLCSLPWLFPAGGMTYLTQPELLSP